MLPFIAYAQDTKDSSEKKWDVSAAAYYYFIQGEEMHPTIIGCADYKSLHLEARYNYEDINTASIFAGWTFGKDGKFSYSVTPMAGIAAGNSNGVLPGLECSATYSIINFYTENEYMLDFKGKENNFFYSWTQLSANTFKNMQAGVLTESLRWFKTKFDVQRGIYAEYSPGNFTFDIYGFNLFTSSHFFMASVTYQF